MGNIKADLHMHGLIGFQRYWQEKQGTYGKNLLKLITNRCFEKDIGVCALTSEEFEIPKNSVHDRLNYLKNNHALDLEKQGYETFSLGENVFAVMKGEGNNRKETYFVSGQAVIVKEEIRKYVDEGMGYLGGSFMEAKRYGHLVVGSNQVPNMKNFDSTIKYASDNGLIQIAKHKEAKERDLFDKYSNEIDAIEGHDAQMIHLEQFSFLPLIGKYNRGINKKSKEFAARKREPAIAVSNAHDISGIGSAYIEFNADNLNKKSEDAFLSSLKNAIRNHNFWNKEGYQNPLGWWGWNFKFQHGIRFDKDKIEIRRFEDYL